MQTDVLAFVCTHESRNIARRSVASENSKTVYLDRIAPHEEDRNSNQSSMRQKQDTEEAEIKEVNWVCGFRGCNEC